MLKIGAEKITKSYENPHPTPHRHNYYELYFLLDGERQVFIEHEMFKLTKNCLAIIPPFHYHKTEGGGYSRINVNIHPEELDDRSCELFMNLTNDKAIVINDTHLEAIHILLEEAVNINTSSMNSEEKADSVLSLFKAIITLLSIQKNKPIQAYSKGKTRKTTANKNTSSEILQIVSYIKNQP